MSFRDIILAPFRWAGLAVKMLGRIVVGVVGFAIMAAGLLLIDPFGLPLAGVPVFAVGLILTCRAIF